MLKDMMTGFELYEPPDVDSALDMMAEHEHVYALGALALPQRARSAGRHDTDACRLRLGEIGHLWRMALGLHEEHTEIGRRRSREAV